MKNKEVAEILYEIADLLEMQDVEWKPRAYRRAARSIEALSEPIEDVHERGELQEIDGVGEAIAGKVAEYLETGELWEGQTDEGELGDPYSVIDPILRHLVDDRHEFLTAAEETGEPVEKDRRYQQMIVDSRHKHALPPGPGLADRASNH